MLISFLMPRSTPYVERQCSTQLWNLDARFEFSVLDYLRRIPTCMTMFECYPRSSDVTDLGCPFVTFSLRNKFRAF